MLHEGRCDAIAASHLFIGQRASGRQPGSHEITERAVGFMLQREQSRRRIAFQFQCTGESLRRGLTLFLAGKNLFAQGRAADAQQAVQYGVLAIGHLFHRWAGLSR